MSYNLYAHEEDDENYYGFRKNPQQEAQKREDEELQVLKFNFIRYTWPRIQKKMQEGKEVGKYEFYDVRLFGNYKQLQEVEGYRKAIKLSIAAPDSIAEQQADISVKTGSITASNQSEANRENDLSIPNGFEEKLSVASSNGIPIENSDVNNELLSEADTSRVYIHNDSQSTELADSINARAFTHNGHIYLGSGESTSDDSLIQHELTHTQQGDNTRIFRAPKDKVLDTISKNKVPAPTIKSKSEPASTGNIMMPSTMLGKVFTMEPSTLAVNTNSGVALLDFENKLQYEASVEEKTNSYRNHINELKENKAAQINEAKSEINAPEKDTQLTGLINKLNKRNEREQAIADLYALPGGIGWNVLLWSAGSSSLVLKTAVTTHLTEWADTDPVFLDFLSQTANSHQSALLSSLAAEILMLSGHVSNYDTKAAKSVVVSKVNIILLKLDSLQALFNSKNIYAGGVSGAISRVSEFIPYFQKLDEKNIRSIVFAERKVSEYFDTLLIAEFQINFLSNFITNTSSESSGYYTPQHSATSSIEEISSYFKAMSDILYDIGIARDVKKENEAITYAYSAKLEMLEVIATSRKNLDKTIIDNSKSNLEELKENLDLLAGIYITDSGEYSSDAAFNQIDQFRVNTDALLQLLPELSTLAETEPMAFYNFWKEMGDEMYCIAAGVRAMGVLLRIQQAYEVFNSSLLLYANFALSEYRKLQKARLLVYLMQADQAVKISSQNPGSANETADMLSTNTDLASLLASADDIQFYDKILNTIIQIVVAVVIVIAAIYTAGAAVGAIMPLLGAAEAGVGLFVFGEGVMGTALGFTTGLAIESAAFLTTQKMLTSLVYGQKAADWDRFGYDMLETMITFGVLKAVAPTFSAAEKGVKNGLETTAVKGMNFVAENLIFVSLEGLYSLSIEKIVPEELQHGEFDFIDSLGHSFVFMAGLKLGMAATAKLHPNENIKLKDEAKQKELDQLSDSITLRILEQRNRDLSPAEQSKFEKDVAELLHKKASIYKDAAKLPENKGKRFTLNRIADSFTEGALNLETGGMAQFNFRASGDMQNVFLFEGKPNELISQVQKTNKNATLEKAERGENIWMLKDGKGGELMLINVKATPNFAPKFEKVLRESDIKNTAEETRTDFWKLMGDSRMADLPGADAIVTQALQWCWRPFSNSVPHDHILNRANRFMRSQKNALLYETIGAEIYTLKGREILEAASLESLQRVLPQTGQSAENITRLINNYPLIDTIQTVQFKQDYIELNTLQGEQIIRIDNAPFVNNPNSIKLSSNIPLAIELNGTLLRLQNESDRLLLNERIAKETGAADYENTIAQINELYRQIKDTEVSQITQAVNNTRSASEIARLTDTATSLPPEQRYLNNIINSAYQKEITGIAEQLLKSGADFSSAALPEAQSSMHPNKFLLEHTWNNISAAATEGRVNTGDNLLVADRFFFSPKLNTIATDFAARSSENQKRLQELEQLFPQGLPFTSEGYINIEIVALKDADGELISIDFADTALLEELGLADKIPGLSTKDQVSKWPGKRSKEEKMYRRDAAQANKAMRRKARQKGEHWKKPKDTVWMNVPGTEKMVLTRTTDAELFGRKPEAGNKGVRGVYDKSVNDPNNFAEVKGATEQESTEQETTGLESNEQESSEQESNEQATTEQESSEQETKVNEDVVQPFTDEQLRYEVSGNIEYLQIDLGEGALVKLKREAGGEWLIIRRSGKIKLSDAEILSKVPEDYNKVTFISIDELKSYLWNVDENTIMQDVMSKGVKVLFRGTTRSNSDNSIYPGNTNSINEPSTSVSTDPVKATIFGIESQTNSPGNKGVLQIAVSKELTQITFNPANYRLEKELELILRIKPEDYSKLTQIELTIDEARMSVKDVLGIELPSRINRDESTELLETLPETSLQKSYEFYLYVLKLKGIAK
jgi:Domain of unknown function (DUF4157)